ncbi:barrier-to-autointegration factor-like [Eurosta solidaginis]|uniref:barrier-to-autointegration factor-like n=1 Tax=Eurosta solidaginis TaxID=178769 RepID=UPI003530A40C
MGNKSLTELAGIGDTLGGSFIGAGFDKAYTVLGQYLILKKYEGLFKDWMKGFCNASSKLASDCYNCLND